MTKTLTEQWREGTLNGGIYYCKTKSYGEKKLWFHHRVYGGMYAQTYGTDEMFPEEDIIEVLAPVPSYEEYQDIIQQNVNQEAAIETYIEDIKLLQEQKKKVIALIKDGRFVEALQELENDR